ncbi:MAG: hypothetical protein ACRD8Z_26430 [Nitrososphaeraceae archaeon]
MNPRTQSFGLTILIIFVLGHSILIPNPTSYSSFMQEQKVLGGGSSFLPSTQKLPDAIDTFSAKGLLASTLLDPVEFNNSGRDISAIFQEQQIFRGQTVVVPWIVGGYWNLDVENGDVTEFQANFTMIKANGTRFHSHELSNFVLNAVIPVVLDPQSGTTFTGTFDIEENGEDEWLGTQTRVTIPRLNTISLFLDNEHTDNHFFGQPLYGIVQSLKVQNGTELIKSFIS